MGVAGGHRYRFTVDQYHRMGALGVFEPDCRVELLDGEIFEMTPSIRGTPAWWIGSTSSASAR